MNKQKFTNFRLFILLLTFLATPFLHAQKITVGNGSYTTVFPGTDSSGRNGFPSGTPQLSGNAVGKPVPTNDWWSKLVKEDHADNLFNYPMTLKTTNQGLITTYVPWGVIGDNSAIVVGVTGLDTNKATVSDYSDWTVTMNWKDANHELQATSGVGMPFVYFEKDNDDEVRIEVNSGNVTIQNEKLLIENASNEADFIIYAPMGSTWSSSGNIYTSSLNNQNYWSLVMLPQTTVNVAAAANSYQKYAYVFPVNTEVDWSYNSTTSKVITNFKVTTEVKEGIYSNVLLGLLPHQWDNLTTTSAMPNQDSYTTVRGELKTLDGNQFSVENRFSGILPTLPYLANYSTGFSSSDLANKINQIKNDGLSDWTDSYNEGQVMNRLIQTARIADQTGDFAARNQMVSTVKERLENWLTYQSGEKAFLFYYNSDWTTLLGYPAGHGQDNNINDHHFHWGYFIHAAAFVEQFEPGWSDQWGEFINYLIRDAASHDRKDSLFPFLRNFSPYAGHCWANGFATFPQGNDQESTSESMQFNSSLIHWGTITNNDEIRDLGIYLYTTEQSAVEEYWFDMEERNFKADQQYGLVARVWGNSYDNGTFWTSDIAASYGIELYPMHGGSLYLGQNEAYQQKIWNELQINTGILNNSDTNPNLWHDTIWKYLALLDPEKAIELYNSSLNRNLKFGISDAQTYHWIHTMNAMGKLKADVTANYPIAAVFEKNGEKTYVAHNYTKNSIVVSFSDGYTLDVPAQKMVTNRDSNVSGVISSDFNQAYPNGSVNLSVAATGDISKVVFYDGEIELGEVVSEPYLFKAKNLTLGKHDMYARVHDNVSFNVSNTISITVGEQIPYSGTAIEIPGVFESGHYDAYQGGTGQDVSYIDISEINEGDFRSSESVDAAIVNGEGATIGWISSGEWVEYTVDVITSGNYDVSFRYASDNSNGGGPFYIEVDGDKKSDDISVSSTGGWSTFATKTISNIPLQKGKQILRLVFEGGEFNIGEFDFTYQSPLSYEAPYANAGATVNVVLPSTTAMLDGTNSSGAVGVNLNYEWEQIYGPSTILFSDDKIANPSISNLEEGIYKCKLTVGYNNYTSSSEVLVVVSLTGNAKPSISITGPSDNTNFQLGETITITTLAADLDGTIAKVEFFDGATKIGEETASPYEYSWSNATLGTHVITTIATDNTGETTVSDEVTLMVTDMKSCSENSLEAIQGAFSKGYTVTFESDGINVDVIFELLDTDKIGVVAFLWQESPFNEVQMDHVSGNTFSKTIHNLSPGETISYACKFAYSGGLSATKYFSYEVGSSCSSDGDFSLPSDNFVIKTTGETCSGKSNGKIEITGKASYTYNAQLNGKDYSFIGNTLTLDNLAPDIYDLCIDVLGEDYQQCYTLEIDEGLGARVNSIESISGASIEIQEGTAPYTVFVNGENVFTTSNTNLTVPVKKGDQLSVKTAIECEGVFEKTVDFNYNVVPYPNPTKDIVSFVVPSGVKQLDLEVRNSWSQQIISDNYKVINGFVSIDLSMQPSGVYFVKLKLDKTIILKIIKL